MTQLLQNAVYGTAMILAVAVLRGALKDRLLPEARLALWAVCLFRLFTPAAPTSALSFWGLFGRGAREVPAPVVPVPTVGPAAAPSAGTIVPTVPVGPAPAAPVTPAVPAETGTGVPWDAILAAVWIAVGAILAARHVLVYVRTRRAVECAIPLGREDARYAALPKCARLREGPLDGAPLTFGVARPTVVLFPGLEGPELACVLAHEGVHARRRDNLWHYAAAAALTVFWWDPAVWLMARLIRRDVELSCDRAAVRRLGADRRAEYAIALVTLSTQAEGGAFCHGFGPKRTEERIISIMKYKKATITGMALTLALVLAVSVGFASSPETDIPEEDAVTPPVYNDAGLSGIFDDSAELEKYEALLERVLARKISEMLIERANNGETASDLSETGDQDGMYICVREDCPLQPSVHIHEADGSVTYVYSQPAKYSEPETDDQGNEIDYCGLEGCTIQGQHFHHDPEVEDSAGDDGEPIGCPPEAIDKDFYQKYLEAHDQDFGHNSGYAWEEMEKFYMTPDEYAAKVEEHRAELQAAVDKGLITQEEMDLAIACAEGEIQRVRSGEMVPFYNVEEEGRPDGLTFTFGYENADYVGSLGVMRKVPIN